ncbi:MAG: SDR family oxidoreductase [Rhodospirillaceae bacterium]|jgi:3-oxoacyl-[acyl-carrier protein] reductase|nr:SDR family oxidoreductase [Rhodospirillaceae bacterium]MBT5456118.1 SDR family oxidoreductase [Rhodospirillaceae bacterium]
MDIGIKGKRALIMGSSYGMGNGVARALAAEGVDIVLTARSQDILEREAKDIADTHGVRVEAIACDLAEESDVNRLVDFALDRMGGIDIQFNNCGGPPRMLPSEADDKLWRDWFEIMVLSAVRATGAVMPGMRERGWGRVLSMTSSNILLAATANVLSSSLRMSLVGWSKALSNEVAKDGVTVNCLIPGRIATDRVTHGDAARAERAGVTPEEMRARMIADAPMGRDGTVEEMASVALLLCSQQAGYINGSAIKVDGGRIPVTL